MDGVRSSRSTHRHNRPAGGHKEVACSQQSVLSALERFVQSVESMDATILVPSRLRDMTVGGTSGTVPPSSAAELYDTVRAVRNELLWGPSASLPTSSPVSSSPTSTLPGGTMLHPLTPQRAVSTDEGIGSASSDTDSDFDSVSTSSSLLEHTSHLATAFRHHLQGLHAILHQLADCADHLSATYQREVGGGDW